MAVDYIVITLADVDVVPNANEVRDIKYVSPDELREMFRQPGKMGVDRGLTADLEFTPWFRLICRRFLFEWWESLGDLGQFREQREVIHRML